MNFEQEIIALKERNTKVDIEKKWERSATRRIFIALLTYIFALVWLYIIRESSPILKSFIPVAGYILSTLSLPIIKNWWLR